MPGSFETNSGVLGLHLRAAAAFARLASTFRSQIWVVGKNIRANGKSILDLTTLAAACGTALDIEAHGPDAEEAVAALSDLIVAGV